MLRLSLLISTDDDVAIPYQYYRCRYTMKTWNVTKFCLFPQTLCIIAHLLYSRASLIHIHKIRLFVPVSIAELTSVPSLIILPLILFLLVLLHYVAKLDQHFLLGRDLGKCLKITKKRVVHSRWRRLKGNAVWWKRLTFSEWAEI